MEAVNYINKWTGWLIPMIPIGAACVVTYHSLMKSFSQNEGEIQSYNAKIRKTFVASAIGLTIAGFIHFIKLYFI